MALVKHLSRFCLGTGTKMVVKSVDPKLLLIIGSPTTMHIKPSNRNTYTAAFSLIKTTIITNTNDNKRMDSEC